MAMGGDVLRIYLVALGGAGEPAPVVFYLNSPFDKTASEENPSFPIDPLMESLPQEIGNARLLLKFVKKNNLDEVCWLDLDVDDTEKKDNVYLTIHPAKSTATLFAYERSEDTYVLQIKRGEKIWKSVHLYSVVPASNSDDTSVLSIFGDTEQMYKGRSSCHFYPLNVNLAKDFKETDDILGEGSYGVVRRCVRNDIPCAIKRIFGKPSGSPPSEVEGMLKLFGADNVVNIYSAWGQEQANSYIVYIAMEIFERSLEEYLAARLVADLPKSTLLFIEVMTGVKSMHDAGVIHRDLKPMNILMDREEHVAIADFGTCVVKPSPGAAITYYGDKFLGTHYYSDPLMGSHFRHDEKVDIYSCGIMYSEMHLTDVSKRKKLLKDMDQKIRYSMTNKCYNFLQSSIWKGWSGDIEIVKQTLLIKASPSIILRKLGVSSDDDEESGSP